MPTAMPSPSTARRCAGTCRTPSSISARLDALPRVDIAYAYVGSDGTAVRAFLDAGAKGIVSAGFAPGFPGTADTALLTGGGARRVSPWSSNPPAPAAAAPSAAPGARRGSGFLVADNLNPQKARLLLALALTVTHDPAEITRIFATY